MFSGCTLLAYSKETQLGSSDQEAFPAAGKNTRVVLVPYSYLRFRLALPDSVSYFFFLYLSPSLPLCMVFDSISCNVDEVLIYCGGIDRPGDRSISNDLIQMFNFPTWIPNYDSHSPALLICFFLLTLIFFFAMAISPLGNSDHGAISVSIDFLSNSQQDALFHRIAYD